MKQKIKSFVRKVRGIFTIRYRNFMEDSLATFSLIPIQEELKFYYPYTDNALYPMNLKIILNDIVIHQRKNIVELGAGISTIYISALLRKNNIKATITTIEENKDWADYLSQKLKDEGLSEFGNIIYVPLEKIDNKKEWYNRKIIEKIKNTIGKVDCLIVDAPMAKYKTIRIEAVPAFYEIFDSTFSVFLDDCHRKGEKSIIKYWNKKFKLDFKIYNRLGIYIKSDDKFNIL